MKIQDNGYAENAVKLQRIRAFDRMLGLSKIKNYHGRPLDDRSLSGTIHCIKTWLDLNDQKFIQSGGMFTLEYNDVEYVFNVVSSTTLSQHQTKVRQDVESRGGEYYLIAELSDFLKIWDDTF